jgi:hypothetical protein
MARHAKRFTGVPRQLLDRRRLYMLAWVDSRWEVVAESPPLVDAAPGGALDAPARRASGEEALGVTWAPVTPEELRDRIQPADWPA